MKSQVDPSHELKIKGKRWIKLAKFAHMIDMDPRTVRKLALLPGFPKIVRVGPSYFVKRKDVDDWIEETEKKRFFGPLK